MFGGDARPRVPHLQLQRTAVATTTNTHQHPPATRVSQRIADEVLQDAPEQASIRIADCPRGQDFEADAALTCDGIELFVQRFQQLADRETHLGCVQRPGIQARDVEQAFEQILSGIE